MLAHVVQKVNRAREVIITRVVLLRVHAFVYEMMPRLIARVKPVGIISNCDVCGGSMFNAQCYMHMNDAYFATSTIRFF